MSKYGTPITQLLQQTQFKKFELINLGASGAGKTTRSLTASQFGKVLIRDYDGKVQGAFRQLPDAVKSEVILKNIDVVSCRTLSFPEILQQTLDLKKEADAGTLEYATIIEDTYTNLSEIIYQSVFTDEKLLAQSNSQQLWGKVAYRTSALFAVLQSLPCNLIINCHVKLNEADMPVGPAGKGGFRDLLKARVTDMHYVALENGKYTVRVRNSQVPPVNTSINPKYIDPKGFATKFGLSIFEDYAYRTDERAE